ncbi:histone-lysine N-methyltransferase, H3 lysine-36 specific [Rhodotorula diobovata]|uniref:Histone-lysine N-methyltransferase, H3 lysine-36 specific n=1 Tax=Rhodotorula diobovata TaxID=5288 RepID=A0A5C5G4W5_9BASI|nr:histone-lysine N-methyltransferase, H3 lysine-36 specific [Rhodotorula diobovata]
MVSPSPQPPSYPTPQSPLASAPTNMDLDLTTAPSNGVHPLAQAAHAAHEPASRVKADPDESLDADLATFTAAASARAASAPALGSTSDRKPSLVNMLTASASRSQSPRDRDREDRKPDLPPPFPFASTSAPAADVDAARGGGGGGGVVVKGESADGETPSASGSGLRSGSGSGSGTPKEEEGEGGDDDDGEGIEKAAKVPDAEPQLIGHLPVANEEAGRTFVELEESTYTNKSIGDVKYHDADMARCDCVPDPTVPEDEQACGEHSNCISRVLLMECDRGECRCGNKCQNQRFQKRQYAPISVVKTEKKGFGVRAEADLPADSFIYEYVGEVIGPKPFEVKMKAYANEGIKHFYFMALDRDVFIDATKKGGKGRFLNHSCNPNCVVAKWTVGKKMRMGIFAKRDIQKHEELTFNYNVDRYGHVAQECFCGEPNCVGFIGGKTQTDIGGMDDLYLDALGITAEVVEQLGLKGSKKKKGKKLDEDFTPELPPVTLDEVPKVSSAIRQALQTRRILEKLLTRVQMTTDDEVLRGLMRLHGLNLMNNVLREYPSDVHVISLDLEILAKWKLQTRNKIESSRIEESVTRCLDVADERVQTLAKDVLASWAELQLGYRIPKALLDASDDPDRKRPSSFDFEQLAKRARYGAPSPSTDDDHRPAFVRPTPNAAPQRRSRALPDGWHVEYDRDADRDVYINLLTGARQVRDKKVMALFSTVVVNTMSKYKAQFEPEAFKKRAREVSELLVEKEKKRPSYATDSYDSLAPEKEAKVRSFVKDWVKKLLERKKGGASTSSSSSTAKRPSSSSASTPLPGVPPSPATPNLAASNGAGAAAAAPEAGTPE